MSKELEKCLYSPNKQEAGSVVNESEDFYKEGYIRYFGQSTAVSYQMVGDIPLP